MSDSFNPDEKAYLVDVRFKLCVQRFNGGVSVAHEKLFWLAAKPIFIPFSDTEWVFLDVALLVEILNRQCLSGQGHVILSPIDAHYKWPQNKIY